MVKRLFDFVLSLLGLVLFSPVFLIIYLGQKLTYKGPAFFVQERIGKGGRPFNIYKFRTMVVQGEQDGVPRLAEENDDRLTKFGRFLRNHHLDEQHDKRYVELYQIRPGVTSYATLYNGYTDTMEKMLRRLELDLYYLEHRSWWFDIKIIMKTFLNIIFGKKF